jgi:CheY-like chemotaxis protein/HPt (histidine-containing phosphotransfer) domain-containing protein
MSRPGHSGSADPGSDRPILLAEDHPVNRVALELQLEILGHRVEAVGDGLAALAALSKAPYALLITDCNMPGMDGFELARRIRAAEPPDRRLPILALTATAGPEALAKCQAAGMDLCLLKPVSIEDLRAALALWLPARNQESGVQFIEDLAGPAPGALAELLADYRTSLQDDLAALVTAGAARDRAAIGEAVHRIQGAARAVGLGRVVASCAVCEARLTGPDAALDEAIGALSDLLRDLDTAAL